jgi:pentatricopeptide repeat protein
MAEHIIMGMKTNGPAPNLVCYNAAMSAAVRANQADTAFLFDDAIRADGLQKDVFTCTTLMQAYSLRKDWHGAVALLRSMPSEGITPNEHAYCAAINACEKCGQLSAALDVLRIMCENGLTPNAITLTSVINACKHGGDVRTAVAILKTMREYGLTPDVYTYTNILATCQKANDFGLAMQVFEEMKAVGVAPSLVTYGCLLRICEACRQWSTALELFYQMPMKPDSIVYNTVISVCSKSDRCLKLGPYFTKYSMMERRQMQAASTWSWAYACELASMVWLGMLAPRQKVVAFRSIHACFSKSMRRKIVLFKSRKGVRRRQCGGLHVLSACNPGQKPRWKRRPWSCLDEGHRAR